MKEERPRDESARERCVLFVRVGGRRHVLLFLATHSLRFIGKSSSGVTMLRTDSLCPALVLQAYIKEETA